MAEDRGQLERVRLLVLFACISAGIAVPWAGIMWLGGAKTTALAALLTGLSYLSVPALLRVGATVRMAGDQFLGLLFLSAVQYLLASGGHRSPYVSLLLLLPIFATLLTNRQGAKIWAAWCVASLVLLSALPSRWFEVLESEALVADPRLSSALLSVVLLAGAAGVLLLDDLEERARARLEQTNRDLEVARQDAEQVGRARLDFLAHTSHELRTPMNGILGTAELLLDSRLPETQAHYAQTIDRSARTLLRLLDDVLDLARIEGGNLRVDSAPVAPLRTVRGVIDLLQPAAHDKGVELRLEHDELPAGVLTDRYRLRQILVNLIANAIKFTDQGEVVVFVRVGEHLDFEVRDTGPGIPGDRLASIFEPFEQVDASASRRYGGVGLGLSIARRLAELLGGALTAESELGAGSTFRLRLPLVETDAPQTSVPRIPSVSGPVDRPILGRVLVVEDNPVNQMVVQAQLRRLGLSVTVADGGIDAIEIVGAEPAFDLVLMDCRMPDMDGYETTRRLGLLDGYADVPIVALTADAVGEVHVRCREAGMNGALTKPASREQMAQLLAEHIGLTLP